MESTELSLSERMGWGSTAPVGGRGATGWRGPPGLRSSGGLRRRARATDRARHRTGSWPYVGLAVGLITITTMPVWRKGHHPGGVLAVFLSGMILIITSLVLMAVRRTDRAVSEEAFYTLDMERRTKAVSEEILTEVGQVNCGIVRLLARIELADGTRRATGDGPYEPGREPR